MLSAAAMAATLSVIGGAASVGASTVRADASHVRADASSSFLACEVTDTGGINDRSFNASAYAGLKAAVAVDAKIVPKFLSSVSESDYTPNITDFINDHCGIIVTVGYAMAANTQTAAKANPMVHFAIVDCPGGAAAGCPGASASETTLPNIDNLAYETNQDAFLGGYLAAAMAKPNSIAPGGAVGEFGGVEYPTVTIYMDGWVAGVRYYDQLNHKSVKVYGWYPTSKGRTANNYSGTGEFTGSFTDDDLGKTDTQNLIGQGVSVVFSVAGGVGLGALAAVKSADATSPGSTSMEWVDTDGCVAVPAGCPYFLTSVDKGIAPSVETAVLAAARGTFKGGFYVGDLANNGVSLAPLHDFASKVPASVTSELATLKAGIESGKVSVNPCSYPAAAATPPAAASKVCSG
jgi:basic membrane protein A